MKLYCFDTKNGNVHYVPCGGAAVRVDPDGRTVLTLLGEDHYGVFEVLPGSLRVVDPEDVRIDLDRIASERGAE